MGGVPVAEYGTPSTMEIPDRIEKYLPYYDALLLENHGALTWSTDLNAAYMKMESLEFYAEFSYRTKVLGGAQEFDEENIKRLYEIRRNMNIGGKHPATATPEEAAEAKKLGLPGYQYDFVGTIM